jgi:choline transport protein
MNWSCVIVGATIVFPGIYWIYAARHKYLKDSNSVLSDNVIIVNGVARNAGEVLEIDAQKRS